MPSYAELAERYNANAAKIDRLWSSTVVELAWRQLDAVEEAAVGGAEIRVAALVRSELHEAVGGRHEPLRE